MSIFLFFLCFLGCTTSPAVETKTSRGDTKGRNPKTSASEPVAGRSDPNGWPGKTATQAASALPATRRLGMTKMRKMRMRRRKRVGGGWKEADAYLGSRESGAKLPLLASFARVEHGAVAHLGGNMAQ